MIADYQPALTPIQEHGGYLVKRDDLFAYAGVRGGKVRTCKALAQGAKGGLVTAGARSSPQINIVAHIAARLGLPCRAHAPTGELGPELRAAQDRGAAIIQHRAGYNNVIIRRARDDARARGWREIPFGMQCEEAVKQTAGQVRNVIQVKPKRIVVAVGSGMSLAGILWGLAVAKARNLPALGVRVGADPTKRLQLFGPLFGAGNVELAQCQAPYGSPWPQTKLGELELDPIYEAKCLPYLRPGDLLWVVGIRQTTGNGQQP